MQGIAFFVQLHWPACLQVWGVYIACHVYDVNAFVDVYNFVYEVIVHGGVF